MLSGLVQYSSSLGFICNLRVTTRSPRIASALFHTGSMLRQDIKKNEKGDKPSFWPWSKKNEKEEKLKITKPDVCNARQMGKIILDPECKVAIVVGGTAEVGLSAADSLLYHGARAVVLADEDPRVGEKAAQSLCDFYGKNRARFLRCDPKSSCQLEGVFEESICRYKKVDILFSNLDQRNNNAACPRLKSQETEAQWSNTMTAIHTGIKYMGGKKAGGDAGGIIVNCASIIGFMGWPGDPTPVYCSKEPVAETTMDLAKMYPVDTTGVRIIALLMSNKPFAEIALPDFPGSNTKNEDFSPSCEPSAESRIGKALIHVMSRASTGTTWLSEPAPSLREIPWQIHFPARHGETVDPRIYDKEHYKIEPSFTCVVAPATNCPPNCEDTKCKEIWKKKSE